MHMKNESNEPKLVACYTCEREFNWTRKGYYEVEPEYELAPKVRPLIG
jgi:hypothetical protein